ncbi:hypothetical protein M426DRAFT_325963 [Hypoxylon sp. CI-4A]|nr:hypothetical protein M426DRAFT_325963 [Hypoxylon sp. CI-4A]
MEKTAELQPPRLSASKNESTTTSSAVSIQDKEEGGGYYAPPPGTTDATPPSGDQTETSNALVEGQETGDYVTGYKLIVLLTSVVTFFFLLMLDMSIISTAIPQITSEFHSLQDIGWYTGAYQLTSATLQPLTGKVYTRVKAKWVFLFFFFIFEVGSLICAVSRSSVMFIIGRAIAGMGSSGLQNGAMTVIAGAVPLAKRPVYMSFIMAFGQMGLIVGPLLGGVFTQYVSWRWCFYINLPLGGLAGLFLSLLHVPDQTVKPQVSFAILRDIIPNLDLTGFAIFAPTAIMFLLALQFGASSEYAWNSSTVIGLFVGAGVALPIFLYWEWRIGDKAMIPFSMVRRRVVWVSSMQFALLMTSVFVGAQFFPIYFQSVKGVGPTLSGVYMLPNILSGLVFVLISGALVTKIGYVLPWAVLAGAGTAIAGGLISTWQPGTTTGQWIGYQVIYGLRGAGIQAGVITIQNSLPPSQSALGLAFLIFCQNFSAAVFSVVANVIFDQSLQKQIVKLVPSVDPAVALAAGGSAEAVRALVPAGSPELANVLLAFANSFDTVCYLIVAAASLSFMASWGIGWFDVRKKPEPKAGDV